MTDSATKPGEATPAPPARAELPKQYKPTDHENRIRSKWESSGAFHPDPQRVLRGEAKPYCIVIPPPNVTDRLHLGHALNNTLQDVLIRAHRMMGYETLWMPGTDHAGIATQAVVERRLRKDGKLKGPLRESMKREDFIATVQAFKDEYEATITGQLKAMGCSCDWQRQRFTMDEQCAAAVYEAFFRLFKDGLIYRGKRLVNWDPVLQTAVADDECYEEEIDAQFYYLRYPLVHGGTPLGGVSPPVPSKSVPPTSMPPTPDAVPVTWSELRARGWPTLSPSEPRPSGSGPTQPAEDADRADDKQAWITVATTRPETYLGDTAVAINPKDARAKSLRGLNVELPLIGRIIPIIEDDYVVLPAAMQSDPDEAAKDAKAKFATGFLKVTPAHDPNDYEIGLRHNLPKINIFAPDATISDKHGWSDATELKGAHKLLGLKREDARKLVIKEFEARTVGGGGEGTTPLFAKSIPYRHSVKHSDRSKAVIEPYLSDQWYVKVTDPRLSGSALAAMNPEQRTNEPEAQARDPRPHTHGAPSRPASNGDLTFYPNRYARTFETWHENIRDWCISRQLWWGHQIPVWTLVAREGYSHNQLADRVAKALQTYFRECGLPETETSQTVELTDIVIHSDENAWRLCARTSQASLVLKQLDKFLKQRQGPFALSIEFPSKGKAAPFLQERFAACERDPDVLDTWFSSGLWPISTMGWPSDTDLLRAFNPSSTLCTAREIITLWVSRMVMFNRYLRPPGEGQGPLPFRDVFIHALIMDGSGQKMSKTAGNGVDPLDIIESHGTDAMRFVLCQMTTQTQDVRMPVNKGPNGKNTSPKFDIGRNFCNKLWNASRFVLSMLETSPTQSSALSPQSSQHPAPSTQHSAPSLPDRWLLSRLSAAVAQINTALANYEFSDYATSLYDLMWRDFCDWYIEAIKPTIASNAHQRAVLAHTLESIVRLLHPAAPYITEAIWERLKEIETASIPGIDLAPARIGGLLATAGWPIISESLRDEAAEQQFERLRSLTTSIREVRAQHSVPPKRRITLHTPTAFSPEETALIQTLAGIDTVTTTTAPADSAAFPHEGQELRLSNLADAVDASTERARLEKSIADADKTITTLQSRLSNPGYADRAPPAMVEQTRSQLAKAQSDREAAAIALARL